MRLELPCSFDVVHAAILRHRVAKLQEETPGRAIFVMFSDDGELGNCGELELGKVSDNKCLIEVHTHFPTVDEEFARLEFLWRKGGEGTLAIEYRLAGVLKEMASDDLDEKSASSALSKLRLMFYDMRESQVTDCIEGLLYGSEFDGIIDKLPVDINNDPESGELLKAMSNGSHDVKVDLFELTAETVMKLTDLRAEPSDDTGDDVVLRLGKPGRSKDPSYDEAYQKISSGQSTDSVFAWFCEQTNITKPDKSTRDAFKAAMKRRQNKA